MLKTNSKIILILFFIISLIFVFSGCGIQTTPPIINGTVCGYVGLPDNSKDLTGYTPIPGATVTIVDAEGISHTVLTDENGYYSFDDLNININTVITITKETEEGIQIFKDVVPLTVSQEENYDAGLADAASTGLALVVEGMVQAGETQEEINLDEIASHILYDDLEGYVQQAQNNNQDLTETTITITVYKIINNIVNPPSPTPPTPIYTVTFDSQSGSAVDSQTVEHGEKATEPTAPTKTGYTFGGWYKESGCTSAWNFDSDTVTADVTLYAKWTINTFTLTMSKTGTGTGTTTPTTGIHTYNYGASVTISASPASSSTFTGWSGDATGTSDVELSMTANKSVTATFAIKTYTITASAGSNGSISPSGATTVNHGSNQSFYITSNSGYVVEDVLVDGSSVGAVSLYTFNNVTDNHTISVTFKAGITGKVSDAVTGNGISGAIVTVTLTSGAAVTTTSPQGNYSFSDIPAGTYNIKATATGYIDNTTSVTVVESQPTVVNFALSETLEAGQMRIILTWGPTGDLDSYLWNPSGEKLYYGDKSITGAILDRDDLDGYGPETVTITALSDGTYTFAVHAYSLGGISTFSDTGAVVKLYDSTGLLNTFNIPSGSSTNRWWNVFTLSVSGSGGSVTVNTINTFSSSAPLP